jgi:hypothetical protein
VGVADQDVRGAAALAEPLLHQRLAEAADAGAGVDDDRPGAARAHLDARRVSAVAIGAGSRDGDGAANAPESDFHGCVDDAERSVPRDRGRVRISRTGAAWGTRAISATGVIARPIAPRRPLTAAKAITPWLPSRSTAGVARSGPGRPGGCRRGGTRWRRPRTPRSRWPTRADRCRAGPLQRRRTTARSGRGRCPRRASPGWARRPGRDRRRHGRRRAAVRIGAAAGVKVRPSSERARPMRAVCRRRRPGASARRRRPRPARSRRSRPAPRPWSRSGRVGRLGAADRVDAGVEQHQRVALGDDRRRADVALLPGAVRDQHLDRGVGVS